MYPGSGKGVGIEIQYRFLCRLFPGADQSGRQTAYSGENQKGDFRFYSGNRPENQ